MDRDLLQDERLVLRQGLKLGLLDFSVDVDDAVKTLLQYVIKCTRSQV